jgi:molybdenum cofactor biosynthesis enzyme MoaA
MRVEHPFRSAYNLVVMRTPVEVQLVVTRRCNLACPYCYEHNPNGELIPFDALVSRIDAIHALGTVNLALLGGEPLLHPRIADIVRYAARRCQVSMTTNGFLLSVGQILALNHAGLSNLQISIDTLKPDPARSMKSLSKLRRKLLLLADLAAFDVHVTVVLAPETLDSFRDLIDALREFPFRVSTNLVHDEHGMVKVQGESYDEAWDYHFGRGRPFSYMEESYGRRLLRGERPPWSWLPVPLRRRVRDGAAVLGADGTNRQAHRGIHAD